MSTANSRKRIISTTTGKKFVVDGKGNVRLFVKNQGFAPVSEKVAKAVCQKAGIVRPELDSEAFALAGAFAGAI